MSYALLFEDGFQALCRASYSQNFHQCTTVGDKGVVEVRPGVRENGRPGSVFGQSGAGAPNPKALFINNKEVKCQQTLQQAMLLDAFAEAIQSGTKTFKTPGEMGLRDIRLVEAVYESVKKGGVAVAV